MAGKNGGNKKPPSAGWPMFRFLWLFGFVAPALLPVEFLRSGVYWE